MRVFLQNVSCLLALSLLHNSREDGGKKGSSHFDKTSQNFSVWYFFLWLNNFQIPEDFEKSVAVVGVIGNFGDYTFKSYGMVRVVKEATLAMIQTDMYDYKPGQQVKSLMEVVAEGWGPALWPHHFIAGYFHGNPEPEKLNYSAKCLYEDSAVCTYLDFLKLFSG